jgi:hypothetical protein
MPTIEGEGMPELDLITQQGPYQHGITILDYRLKPRIIQLLHRRTTCGRKEYWAARSDIINFLRPNRRTNTRLLGKLSKTLPGGIVRNLDVFIQAGPKFVARNVDSWEETSIQETIIFIAQDPTWYDPVVNTIAWTLAGVDHLIFPITILPSGSDFIFGTDVIDDSVTVMYTGTWIAYPTVTIVGPLDGMTLLNVSTGEMLHMDYNIPVGVTVTIGLQYGNKYVVDNNGNNLIGTLSEDSDLATFHVAPDPEVAGGNNIFKVTGIHADVSTAVRLSFNTRYIGI